ncbi:MAG: hypothetical protein NTV42_09185, partial [Chloroflexi bacterium]|nr:hypothetical protein [Chloroflexota bacterium]
GIYLFLSLIIIISMSATPGCVKINTGGKTASLVTEATLASDVDSASKPLNPSNTFYVTTETIYLSLKLNSAPANTQVTARLTYIGGEDASKANSTMYSGSLSGQGTQYIAFAMKAPPGGFPQGNYQLAVTANGQDQVAVPFSVQNASAQKGWPTITKLTATPETIALGQSVTLSWDVSDATRVSLQPEIGTIPASGTRSVSPATSTVYKIIASNDAGQTTREVTVNVGAALAGAPDLIITDVFLQECMVYYKVKNIGTVDTVPTYTTIYVDNLFPPLGGTSYVDKLRPGEERGLVFSSYQWPWCGQSPAGGSGGGTYHQGYGTMVSAGPGGGGGVVDWSLLNHTVKVCADGKGDLTTEINKSNNCLVKLWGMLVNYDLLPLAHLAGWRNSAGEMPDFGAESSLHGAYIKMSDGGLEMVPEQVPQGWIQGTWGVFGTDQDLRVPVTAAVKIPARLHLLARVGLATNATGSDGVTFKVGLKDLSDTVNWIATKKMTTPGIFEDWDVNMSDYEGQKGFFILRVEAGPSAVNDFAIWKQAVIQQISD